MKPIEKDCLAITVNCTLPKNNGICVRVGSYVGVVAGWDGGDRWVIDKPITGDFGPKSATFRECRLMRIDGYEATKEERIAKVIFDVSRKAKVVS